MEFFVGYRSFLPSRGRRRGRSRCGLVEAGGEGVAFGGVAGPAGGGVSAGAVMEFPVAASIDGVKMNAPFMWAAEAGLGMQYDITDHLGIYVDCNIQYFFNTGSEIRNAWTDRPLGVSIPIGIRYTW